MAEVVLLKKRKREFEEGERMAWECLRKSINGLFNKVNAANIKNIIPELLSDNLVRGKGLFCRSCINSQAASPAFTDVFAALAAVVNSRFPEVGNLLVRRVVLQLQRAYERNDEPRLLASAKFVAHLVNQQVAHELLALELLTLLLENPTDDSVQVAIALVVECGSLLQEVSPRAFFERLRRILHQGEIDKRVELLIQGMFGARKAKQFKGVRPELDLVEEEDRVTHRVSLLDENIDGESELDIFSPDPDLVENESEEEEEEEEEEESDSSKTDLVDLRLGVYLTFVTCADSEEAGDKLSKMKVEAGQEMEVCVMLLECCSQERTYRDYYALVAQRLCMLSPVYQRYLGTCFVRPYAGTIHWLETNKLRNLANLFAHLLRTDALPWSVLARIRYTVDDPTSSSQFFIEFLFEELVLQLGIGGLRDRLTHPTMRDSFIDNLKNTRLAINFFASTGRDGIVENLRSNLEQQKKKLHKAKRTCFL